MLALRIYDMHELHIEDVGFVGRVEPRGVMLFANSIDIKEV